MMPANSKKLGRLIAVYPIAPAYIQRAVFVAVLSFLFFLSMMFAYYIRQSLLYFLLATGFVILYLLTMYSLVIQRKSRAELFENGIVVRKGPILWNEINSIDAAGSITLSNRKTVLLPTSLSDREALIEAIRRNLSPAGPAPE